MKATLIAALAAVAAAIPASEHPPRPTGDAPNPGTPANFMLKVVAPNKPELQGAFAAEDLNMMSPDQHLPMPTAPAGGSVLLAREGALGGFGEPTVQRLHVTLVGNKLKIGQPLRARGAAKDYFSVQKMDDNSGMAEVHVSATPAGGFYLRNGTAAPSSTLLPVRRGATLLPPHQLPATFLGYRNKQGTEGKFYACPAKPAGEMHIEADQPDQPEQPEQPEQEKRAEDVLPPLAQPKMPVPVQGHELVVGYGLKEPRKECSLIQLQVTPSRAQGQPIPTNSVKPLQS